MSSSIEDISKHDQKVIKLFPNPSINLTSINSEKEIHGLDLLDISGKLVKRNMHTASKTINLDLTNMDVGLYLLRVYHADGTYSQEKLIKGIE